VIGARRCWIALSVAWAAGWPALDAVAAETVAPLVAAAKNGDRAIVLQLIERGADATAAEADGTTALHWAARAGDAALVEGLLRAGAAANAANRYGVTALQLAAVNGDAALMRTLLAAGADANAVLPEGETVLMTAARTGNAEALRVLLEHGAAIDAREQWYGESALIWAAAENHADAVRMLLEHGADADSRSALQPREQRRNGQSILPLGNWTPLMYAARENAHAAAAALVRGGAELDLVDPDGATALAIAIINAHYELAMQLLEAGADPNVVDTAAGMGPLYAAVDMHRLAIGHGRPNPRTIGTLDAAGVVQQLLQHGADPNARLTKPIMQRHHTAGDGALGAGATPLLRAAKSGDVAVMRLLLAAGADPTLTMPNGSTALMYAAGLGWRNGSALAPSYDQGSETEAVEAIGLLIDLGLAIDAVDGAGNTALHAAVTGRRAPAIVDALIARGADPLAANAKGDTPLTLAKARAPELVERLRAAPSAGLAQ
jgi:ankyrin repeat protein